VSAALVIQHATRIHRVTLYLWHVQLCNIFLKYLISSTIFGKTIIEHKMFQSAVPLLTEKFLILRRIRQDIVINVHRSSRKGLVILVRF